MTRRYTNKLLELVDNGILDAGAVLRVALGVMSEAEVKDMCEDDFEIVGRELGDNDDEDDDDEDDDEDEQAVEPRDLSEVLALLEGAGLTCYADFVEYGGPCVVLVTESSDGVVWNSTVKIREIDALLEPLGWELGDAMGWPVDDTHYRETLWSLVPLKKEE